MGGSRGRTVYKTISYLTYLVSKNQVQPRNSDHLNREVSTPSLPWSDKNLEIPVSEPANRQFLKYLVKVIWAKRKQKGFIEKQRPATPDNV